MSVDRPSSRGQTAFTLIELVVVIAIIGILAALILTALTQAKKDTRRAHCISNLRQTGAALQMWLNDNNDWLPPGQASTFGLFMGQHPDYRAEPETDPDLYRYRYQLVYYLANYLGYPAPDAVLRKAPVFFCPAFENAPGVTNILGNICYGLTSTNYFKDTNGNPKLSFNPFGYPKGMSRTPQSAPRSLSAIATERSLSTVYSLVDIDKVALSSSVPGAPTWRLLPVTSIHGTVRNYLYFDNHAQSQQITPPGTL